MDAADNKSSDDASYDLWRKKGENKQTNSSMVKETFLKFSLAALLDSEQRGEGGGSWRPRRHTLGSAVVLPRGGYTCN